MIKLKNLDVYITGQCNYQCEYCYGESDTCGAMEKDVYMQAIAFGHFLNVANIQMCGGEPLVCPFFEEYADIARKNGFSVILRTNGILINKHINFIVNSCSWVGISIDGLPKENAIMRKPRFPISPKEQFDIPIKSIFELKRLNPNLKIILASVASKKNYQKLPDFAYYLIEKDVPIDKWKIYEFINDKFRSGINNSKFAMTTDEFDFLVEKMPHQINHAPVQIQSAHTDRVAANCLIVYQNGDINLLGKTYGNVLTTPFQSIIERLIFDNALDVICDNKENTYEIK